MGFILVLAAMGYALANPFLVCEPYPASGVQPDSFTVVLNGTTYTAAAVKDSVTGAVSLKFDLAGKWATGTNSVKAAAVSSMWGASAFTVPLGFSAGTPAVPFGVGLQVN